MTKKMFNLIGKQQQDDDKEEDPSVILGIDSVYNARSSNGTKSLLTNLKPGPGLLLKCTAWRCKICNVDFPTQAEVIQHAQSNLCSRQSQTSTNPSTINKKSTAVAKTSLESQLHPLRRGRLDVASKPDGRTQEEIRTAKRASEANYRRRKLLNETPEERLARLKREAESKRRRRAAQTQEQREARRVKDAERVQRRLLQETSEERERRLARQAERDRARLATETQEQREARLAAQAERAARQKQVETEEEREVRLAKQAIRDQRRLRSETEEERQNRLQKQGERVRQRRLNETEEEREARLHKFAEYHRNRNRVNIRNEEHQNASIKMAAAPTSENIGIMDNDLKSGADVTSRKRYKRSLRPRIGLPTLKQTVASYTPKECKICGKAIPLRYMKLHLAHHSELEFEKTGVWTRPEDLSPQNPHVSNPPPPPVFNCSICNSCFSQEFLLTMHMRQNHDDKIKSTTLHCSACSKIFKDLATLKKHTSKLHPPLGQELEKMNAKL